MIVIGMTRQQGHFLGPCCALSRHVGQFLWRFTKGLRFEYGTNGEIFGLLTIHANAMFQSSGRVLSVNDGISPKVARKFSCLILEFNQIVGIIPELIAFLCSQWSSHGRILIRKRRYFSLQKGNASRCPLCGIGGNCLVFKSWLFNSRRHGRRNNVVVVNNGFTYAAHCDGWLMKRTRLVKNSRKYERSLTGCCIREMWRFRPVESWSLLPIATAITLGSRRECKKELVRRPFYLFVIEKEQ